jgi:hypothetical protein
MRAERRKSIDLYRDSFALTGQIVLITGDPGLKPWANILRSYRSRNAPPVSLFALSPFRRLICFQFALDPGVQLPALTAMTAMTAFRL